MNTETDFNVFRIRANLRARGDKVATPAWAAWLRRSIPLVAHNFGGEDVLSWWLAERTNQGNGLTRAKIRQLQKACGGNQKTLDRLVAYELGAYSTKRWRHGWTAMDVTHYISILLDENGGTHAARE